MFLPMTCGRKKMPVLPKHSTASMATKIHSPRAILRWLNSSTPSEPVIQDYSYDDEPALPFPFEFSTGSRLRSYVDLIANPRWGQLATKNICVVCNQVKQSCGRAPCCSHPYCQRCFVRWFTECAFCKACIAPMYDPNLAAWPETVPCFELGFTVDMDRVWRELVVLRPLDPSAMLFYLSTAQAKTNTAVIKYESLLPIAVAALYFIAPRHNPCTDEAPSSSPSTYGCEAEWRLVASILHEYFRANDHRCMDGNDLTNTLIRHCEAAFEVLPSYSEGCTPQFSFIHGLQWLCKYVAIRATGAVSAGTRSQPQIDSALRRRPTDYRYLLL